MAKRRYAGKKDVDKAEAVEMQSYKFRGYPSKETEALLWRNINCCRGFWNILVRDSNELYRTMNIRLYNTPADYKDATGYEWLKDADSLGLANVQIAFERAMNAFFSGDADRPHKKTKHKCRDSYTTNCSNRKDPNLFLSGSSLKLPKIKELIPLNIHRKIRTGGVLKNCTVSHDVDGWYFSIQFEYPKAAQDICTLTPDQIRHLGLDMSIPKLYVDSNGEEPGFIRPLRKLEAKLAKEQRKLSRKLEANTKEYVIRNGHRCPVYKRDLSECRNIQKQIARIRKLHAYIRRLRADILHKLSARLTDEYDLISIEDLNMAGIKRALKFGKSASDIGWGMFSSMLNYKQEKKGHMLIKVGRFFPSSKTCSCCGHVHKELKLSDRTYVCPVCGHVIDRDVQAAGNIDMEGLRIYKEIHAVTTA